MPWRATTRTNESTYDTCKRAKYWIHQQIVAINVGYINIVAILAQALTMRRLTVAALTAAVAVVAVAVEVRSHESSASNISTL